MRRFRAFRVVFLAPVLLLAMSCQTGMIHADAIDGPLNRIADRHDAYVQDDAKLTDLEKELYLRTSELLRRIVAEAKK